MEFMVWLDGLGGCMLNATHTRAARFQTVDDAITAGAALDAPCRIVNADDWNEVWATWSRDAGVRVYKVAP